jgi:hypothetical protein
VKKDLKLCKLFLDLLIVMVLESMKELHKQDMRAMAAS